MTQISADILREYDADLGVPVGDAPFVPLGVSHAPSDLEKQVARLNALARTTEGMDIDDPDHAVLSEMETELREALKPYLCVNSFRLRTDHGDHGRCWECGEHAFVETWDRQYLSAGGEWLWGSVQEAHLARVPTQ